MVLMVGLLELVVDAWTAMRAAAGHSTVERATANMVQMAVAIEGSKPNLFEN